MIQSFIIRIIRTYVHQYWHETFVHKGLMLQAKIILVAVRLIVPKKIQSGIQNLSKLKIPSYTL